MEVGMEKRGGTGRKMVTGAGEACQAGEEGDGSR